MQHHFFEGGWVGALVMDSSMIKLHQKQRLSFNVNLQSDLHKIKAGCTHIFDCVCRLT